MLNAFRAVSYGLVMLTIAACSATADGPPGSGGETVGTTGEALTASTTLSAALNGRIVLAGSGGDTIAEPITGSWSVGDDGSGSYQVPLWVPDGVLGLQPSLSIVYGNRNEPGLLGPRWSIGGISVIARCQSTLSGEGYKEAINYASGDEFCLDGARLVRTSGTAGANGEQFRAVKNPYAKIVRSVDGAGQSSFAVYEPDGRIFHYGRTDGSRLYGHAASYPNAAITASSKEVLGWYIDKIVDRFNNSILYSYVTTPSPTTLHTTALQIQGIAWGGTGDTGGQRSVNFYYEDPPSPTVTGAHERFVTGMGVRSGALLSSIDIRGPGGGTGPVPTLRTYEFSYSSPTITGERLLDSIKECDAVGVCKLPTTISWEAGSWSYAYKDLTADAGISDMMVDNPGPNPFPNSTDPNPYVSTVGTFRKIIAADLNSDGRDDIVYRANLPTTGFYSTCLGWANRLAVPDGYFAAAGVTNATANADRRCQASQAQGNTIFPNPTEPLVVNLDTNDNPEVLLTSSYGAISGAVEHSAYSAYFPSGAYAYESGEQGLLTNKPQISIGDIDGDGAREILREKQSASNSKEMLWAASLYVGSSGLVKTYRSVPDLTGVGNVTCGGSTYFTGKEGFAAVDLDGDGVAEILRDIQKVQPDCTSANVATITARGTIYPDGPALPPQNPSTAVKSTWALRWFLDLNGDGLPDVAYVISDEPQVIHTRINTGRGFLPENRFNSSDAGDWVGPGWLYFYESGVRIADMNMDGRQDLVLVSPGAYYRDRLEVRALLSDGNGGFVGRSITDVPFGDAADGWVAPNPFQGTPKKGLGYNTSVVLDYNGDGLPDFLQVQGNHLWLYTRQGKAPDVVTNIAEGTGRNITVSYTTSGDSTVFTPGTTSCGPADTVSCAASNMRGMSLVDSDVISGAGVMKERHYKYTGSVFSRQGQGFLGFQKREIFGPAPSEHTTFTYAPASGAVTGRMVGRAGLFTYAFPNALTPKTQVTETLKNDVSRPHHYEYRSFSYFTNDSVLTPAADPARFSYWYLPGQTTAISYDSTASGAGPTDSGVRTLAKSFESLVYDGYGNVTSRTLTRGDGVTNLQSDVDTWTFDPADSTNWIVGKLKKHTVQSTTPTSSVLRTTGYTTDAVSGAITSSEAEPTGDASVHLLKCFGRDSRGRITSVVHQSSGPCGNPAAGFRQTTFAYEDADGVYLTTVTNALGQKTREWRHPGLGVLVESDDANGLAASASYDTFGRKVAETAISGASSTTTYLKNYPAGFGSSYTIYPEGKTTRAVTVNLDVLGRESSRTSPIDANKILTVSNTYDYADRLIERTTFSNGTALNTERSTYDDLGRLTSWCHLVADGTNQCVTQSYDGLMMTRTDESGRVTTRILDAMGRLSKQRAAIATGVSDATFSYGAFNTLSGESVEDGSGNTSIGYDVLGRVTSVYRKGMAGPRITTYNQFGESMSSYKLNNADGSHIETVSYQRDQLGRIVLQSSAGGSGPNAPPGFNRLYFWDRTSAGTAAPAAIGKLVDTIDSGFRINTHLDYDTVTGQVKTKTWTILNSLIGAAQSYALNYTYDSQGRVDTLTYPTIPGEAMPYSVKYAYDQYNGRDASLTDPANPARPLWATSKRNERGDPTLENMSFGAGTTITTSRSTTYYAPTGAVNRSTICSYSDFYYLPHTCSGGSSVTYTYQADGLPATIRQPNSLTSTFDYDNLGRLTSWKDDYDSQPVVSFTYDSDGNLKSRSWSTVSSTSGPRSETVTYGTTVDASGVLTARTLAQQGAIVDNPTQVVTSTYGVDKFLRVTSTPTLSGILYTEDDQFGHVIETNGQHDTLLYDATGRRVVTFFGDQTQANSWYRITLDGVFELNAGKSFTAGPYALCRLTADGKVIGDVWRKGTSAARTVNFYLTNRVGTVLAEAQGNSLANTKNRDNFDPFGNQYLVGLPYLRGENSGDGTGPSSRYGYGGHDRDTFYPGGQTFGRQGWGTVDMLARNYNPRLGQFMTPDTLISNPFDRRDYNPVAYARNAPTILNDPSGHAVNGEIGSTGNTGAGGVGGSVPTNSGAGGMTGMGAGGYEGATGFQGGGAPGSGGQGGHSAPPAPSADYGQGATAARSGSDAGYASQYSDGGAFANGVYQFQKTETYVITAKVPSTSIPAAMAHSGSSAAPVNPGGSGYHASEPTTNTGISGGGGTTSGSNIANGLGAANTIQSGFDVLVTTLKFLTADPSMRAGLEAASAKANIFGGMLQIGEAIAKGGENQGLNVAGAAGSVIAGAAANGAISAAAASAGGAVGGGLLSAGAGVEVSLGLGAVTAGATHVALTSGVGAVGALLFSGIYIVNEFGGASW